MEFNIELVTLLIATTTIVSAVFFITIYLSSKRRREREIERETKAELSYVRERLEREILELNKRLYSDSSRWKSVNHLLLNNDNSSNLTASNTPINSDFFKNTGINISSITVMKDLVFFLTPFHNDFNKDYEWVRNLCEILRLKCIRGDEEFIKGNILKYIIEKIMSSRIVIANLNGRNPNVYYELGIAHAIGKPVILIAKSFDEIPFDLQSKRIIVYNDYSELKEQLTIMLYQVVMEE